MGWRERPSVGTGARCLLADACGASGSGAERGEERVHLDLAHRTIADGRVEHAGQREVKAAPVAERALRPDLSVMRFDDSLADGKAQAGASLLARRGVGDLVELPEDAPQILRRDPLPLVRDDHLVFALVLAQLDRDLAP